MLLILGLFGLTVLDHCSSLGQQRLVANYLDDSGSDDHDEMLEP